MRKYLLLLVSIVVLSACSGEDPLENISDVSVPDRLTGCVVRTVDGACVKAVCVADDEDDCESWAKACESHDHLADVRDGHDTCERREAE